MTKTFKTRVLKRGRSQMIQLPDELWLDAEEVVVRREPQSGDLILSPVPSSWEEIFAALDRAGIPDDFLTER